MAESSRADSKYTSLLTSDPFLKPFLEDDFDPADYFNAILPAWDPETPNAQAKQEKSTPSAGNGEQQKASLAEISTQVQAHVTKLDTQLSILSNNLTQLVDEILRSGSRLSYEVEVLRGDTASLHDTIYETLRDDIKKFLPKGYPLESNIDSTSLETAPEHSQSMTAGHDKETPGMQADVSSGSPEYIDRLRTLGLVRDRLESVVQTFGAAIDWVLPPSELASENNNKITSSFITISAPDPVPATSSSSEQERKELETKGTEYARKVRAELEALIADGTDIESVEAAKRKVEALRELTQVWKGTVEEKPRIRFVDSLAKMIDEKTG